MKKLFLYLMTTAGLTFGSQAFATYSCDGPVSDVALNPGGIVTFSSIGSFSAVYICQIGGTRNGVGPEQCKAILAFMMSAQAQQKQIRWTFNDGLTCTTHPAWADLTGWYYGPEFFQ